MFFFWSKTHLKHKKIVARPQLQINNYEENHNNRPLYHKG